MAEFFDSETREWRTLELTRALEYNNEVLIYFAKLPDSNEVRSFANARIREGS